MQSGISHEDKRFPHSEFAMRFCWSCEFAVLTNRKQRLTEIVSVYKVSLYNLVKM